MPTPSRTCHQGGGHSPDQIRNLVLGAIIDIIIAFQACIKLWGHIKCTRMHTDSLVPFGGAICDRCVTTTAKIGLILSLSCQGQGPMRLDGVAAQRWSDMPVSGADILQILQRIPWPNLVESILSLRYSLVFFLAAV